MVFSEIFKSCKQKTQQELEKIDKDFARKILKT